MSLFRSALALAGLTLKQIQAGKRAILLLLILLAPTGFAILAIAGEPGILEEGTRLFNEMALLFFLQVTMPLFCLLVGVPLIHGEVEERTMVYVLTRPIPRAIVPIVKIAAAIVMLAVFSAGSVIILDTVANGGRPDIAGRSRPFVEVAVLGGTALIAVFCALGALMRRPLPAGFILAFVWEGILANVPLPICLYTITTNLRAILVARMPALKEVDVLEEISREVKLPAASDAMTFVLTVAIAGTLAAALIVKRRSFEGAPPTA